MNLFHASEQKFERYRLPDLSLIPPSLDDRLCQAWLLKAGRWVPISAGPAVA